MDPVPTLRSPNLPFPIDLPANGGSPDTHFFYCKQFSQTPMPLSSEWGEPENVPPKLPIHGTPKHLGGSPNFLKANNGVVHVLEESVTPSRKHIRPSGGNDTVYTPRKTGTIVSSGRPPNVVRPMPGKSGTRAPASDIFTMDVLWAMLNDLTGKDKMAKLAQYLLRLLLHHSKKTQRFLSDDTVSIRLISNTYASNGKVWDSLMPLIKSPKAFVKVLVVLTCSVFSTRMAGFVPALALYRRFLRFGKSPFRFHGLLAKVRQNMYKDTKAHTWKISDKFFTKATLGDCIALYYNINDDMSLLCKVNLLKNKTLKTFASRHEAYAWYCDSWFALYNAYHNLQKLSQQEFDMKISIQVKKRSRVISRQVLGANSLQVISPHPEDDLRDTQALHDIQFRITNAHLEIYKTISDIVFNSYTVFNARLYFENVQIWMGISASFLSLVKLFREKKRALAG